MWTERWWGFSEHFSTNIDFINTFFASDYYFNPRWFIIKSDKFCITSGNLPQSEAATGGDLRKNVFLGVSQNLQENTCARASFLIKLQDEACIYIKEGTLAQVFSCEFCEISWNVFFIEHLWATVSTYFFFIEITDFLHYFQNDVRFQEQPQEVFYKKVFRNICKKAPVCRSEGL